MAKLNKLYYYTRKGEKKVNCYCIRIPKEMVEKARLQEDVKIIVENDKIIIKNA